MQSGHGVSEMIDQLWPAKVEPEFIAELRTYVAREVTPHGDHIDREDYYPLQIVRDLGRRGYNTVTLEPEYGGRGLSYKHAVSVIEEVAVGSAAVVACMITIFQSHTMIGLFGADSLKARYLPEFSRGLISSYALTEARHGSDIRRLDTKARRDGSDWIISGEKHFMSGGSAAEFAIVLAETETGVSTFAVPFDLPGIEVYEGDNTSTFGLRNGPHSNVRFHDVRLPADHLIGVEGKGVRQAVTVLDHSRTLGAALSMGVARAAFQNALLYARDRVAFDQTVLEFQGIQWYFSEMLAEMEAARLLMYRAADSLDSHQDIARWSSEAKYKATLVATEVAGKAIRICGAYGVTSNAPFGRYLRDAKAYEVAGGSTEILKNTIAKYILPLAGLGRAATAERPQNAPT